MKRYKLIFKGNIHALTKPQYVEARVDGERCGCGYCFPCHVWLHDTRRIDIAYRGPVVKSATEGLKFL